MPVYEYEGVTKQGALRKGKMDAADKNEVTNSLRTVGVFPTSINLEKKSVLNMDLSQFEKVTLKDIYIFSREFSYIIASGMGIVSALDVLQDETENKKFKAIISNVSDSVKKGQLLSKAMEEYDEFPELFVNMVKVGESTGNLDDVMIKMADNYEKEYKQQQKVKQALTYPAVICIIALVVVSILVIKVVPMFTSMILQSGGSASNIPVPTKIIMAISNGITHFWWLYIAFIILIIIGFRYLTKIKRLQYDKFKIDLPIVGKINKRLIAARFARTFGIVINSGLTVMTSIDISANVLNNVYVKNILISTKEEMQKGASLADTLTSVGIFPTMLTQMIKIGEETGTLDSVLTKTAEFYDGEIEVATAQLTALIEPLMIVILGVVVGFIIISIMLPIFQIYSLAGK
ncbi:type IV pilus assembly protein PilC [Clostridium acidisoli DSM 12555]|uniref:Type IV pilus assembly protein PilC n=1 Tax=Clostridium acidisoli DSM 12555 TaxID=1121291 RepID=A0A1W1XKP7_9CLOT|nr:type II secretion system F family protein [Clostridium acidisoli]SMC24412.1 type IV pilus assembly protein PilC [Clostridium acidisoli DSM 12555]